MEKEREREIWRGREGEGEMHVENGDRWIAFHYRLHVQQIQKLLFFFINIFILRDRYS